MNQEGNHTTTATNRIKIFRWYFYIALVQFLLYFIVPVILFPNRVIVSIEVISALTVGLLVGMFLLLVAVLGLFRDKERQNLYITVIAAIVLYFTWAGISWAFIEHMDYLLH